MVDIRPVNGGMGLVPWPCYRIRPICHFGNLATGNTFSSWSDHLMNMSSCEEEVPIVTSVPIKTKCLSGVETIISLDAVGAPETTVALTERLDKLGTH